MIERFNHSLSSECPLKHSSVVVSFNLMWPEQIFLLIMNMMNAWRKSQKRHCSSDDVTRKDPPLLFLVFFLLLPPFPHLLTLHIKLSLGFTNDDKNCSEWVEDMNSNNKYCLLVQLFIMP